MLIVAVEVVVEDGTIDQVRDAIHNMETESRKEPGCLTYAFSVDINDPNMVRVIERWESSEALATHFKTPHMAAFREALGRISPKSMDIKAYQVEGEVPLPG